jgi:hypothetical protein
MKTNDHPEEDETSILNNEMHMEFQSLIGMMQWVVSLCRINICYAVSSLSRFCACPREGHMTRALRVWGYLKKYPNRSLNINPNEFSIPGEYVDYIPLISLINILMQRRKSIQGFQNLWVKS